MFALPPFYILDRTAFSKSFPLMGSSGDPFLVRLTVDKKTGLPVKVTLKKSSGILPEEVGSELEITSESVSYNAATFRFNQDPEKAALVVAFPPNQALGDLDQKANHLNRRLLNNTPNYPIPSTLHQRVKEGDMVKLTISRSSQNVLRVVKAEQEPLRNASVTHYDQQEVVFLAPIQGMTINVGSLFLI